MKLENDLVRESMTVACRQLKRNWDEKDEPAAAVEAAIAATIASLEAVLLAQGEEPTYGDLNGLYGQCLQYGIEIERVGVREVVETLNGKFRVPLEDRNAPITPMNALAAGALACDAFEGAARLIVDGGGPSYTCSIMATIRSAQGL